MGATSAEKYDAGSKKRVQGWKRGRGEMKETVASDEWREKTKRRRVEEWQCGRVKESGKAENGDRKLEIGKAKREIGEKRKTKNGAGSERAGPGA
jgi:hypothetical protein